MNGVTADLYWTAGNVEFTTYAGPSIVVENPTDKTYDFYSTIADALAATGNVVDNVFTYSKATADAIRAQLYTVTFANGIYTVGAKLNVTNMDKAIEDATNAMNGITVQMYSCLAGNGNRYVLAQSTIDTLNAAIAVAQTARNSGAADQNALDAAVQTLCAAIDAFEASVQPGTDHKDEGKDHKCDYNCGKNDMGTHANSNPIADHNCDYCGEKMDNCTPANDDGDCTTAVTCTVCGEITTAAKTAHTPGADDGDCTTAVGCTECGTVTTAAKAAHTGGSATCTAKATCSVCGKAYGELAQHIYDGDTDATCNVCGAERTVENANGGENNTNGNENTANGSENNAQNGNTEAPAKKGLSGGAIAGIVIGAVAVLGGGVALLWFAIKKKRL
jgi:hypothetical protein